MAHLKQNNGWEDKVMNTTQNRWKLLSAGAAVGVIAFCATTATTTTVAWAEDLHAALGYSPATGDWAAAYNVPSLDAALSRVEQECQRNGGGCIVWHATNACVAMTVSPAGHAFATGATRLEAQLLADNKLLSTQNAAGYAYCSRMDPVEPGTGNVVSGVVNARNREGPPENPPVPAEGQQKQEITLSYGDATLVGIPAFVGITNNAGKPAVNCAYMDGINNIKFTVTGDVASRVDIPGIPTGTVYHVTVTCEPNLVHQEDKQF
jgi:hypothetical protein